MSAAAETSLLRISFYMGLNFTVSVLIVWVNKYAYQRGFHWNTCMTALHFLTTYLGLVISARVFGLFEIVRLPIMRVLPISLAFCGFVVFNNLSLQYNPVGVYQLLKVLTTPVIVGYQALFCQVSFPMQQILSLVVTCCGVILATVTNVETTFLGLVFGSAGILSTSVYQIWVKTEQDSLQVSAPQLLYNQAFVSFVMLLGIAPFLEDVYGTPESLLAFNWFTPSVAGAILVTALLAFLVNLSIFLVIGKTSAVSYNVLGHAKLCCILISGYVLFQEEASAKNIAGVLMAACGIFLYTHLKLQPVSAAAPGSTAVPEPKKQN